MNDKTIKTTAGEAFTERDSQSLAYMVYKRFGRDYKSAAAAWRRMLQNNATDAQFKALVEAKVAADTEKHRDLALYEREKDIDRTR